MITAETKLLCIFGNPVKHSKSPLMHNAVIEKLGLNYTYMAFDVKPEELGNAVKSIKTLGISGVNITIPHKENVIKYLDYITDEAKNIGSVNTVFFDENGKIVGDNTDGRGFVISLMKDGEFDPKNKKCVVMGAGGASRAVCAKLVSENIKSLALYDIDQKKSADLITNLKSINENVEIKQIITKENLEEEAKLSELVVNCTPIGMKESDPELLSDGVFNGKQFVFDLIYNPAETKLLKTAREKGCRTINGLGMLVYQGALSFERWTGVKPDTEIMFRKIKGE